MPKYEIMMIVDPKNLEESENLSRSVFGSAIEKYEKLDRVDLAYEINKTKVANYILINLDTDGPTIKEFVRRANISKFIWRHLIIRLDTERAIKTLSKMIPLSEIKDERRHFNRENRYNRYNRNEQRHSHAPRNPENVEDKKEGLPTSTPATKLESN